MEHPSLSQYLYQFEAIGCQWEIETREKLSDIVRQLLQKRIEIFDSIYSRFRRDSLVSKIARASAGGEFLFPEDASALFDFYDQLYHLSNKGIDPLIGRRLELLGYDRTYSLVPVKDLKYKRYDWMEDVRREGTLLKTKRPLVIDVGAAGKGYLVDLVSNILKEQGFAYFIVDAGGDIRHFGEPVVQVGLEDPDQGKHVIGVVGLQNEAIGASAVNRRSWGKDLHHILDANTGLPVRKIVASWVLADDAMTADGLATALFFDNGDTYTEHFNFSYVRMFSDRRVEVSRNFKGKLFSK
jgi:thiamine biosynthesis lipoprotein